MSSNPKRLRIGPTGEFTLPSDAARAVGRFGGGPVTYCAANVPNAIPRNTREEAEADYVAASHSQEGEV